MKTCPYCAEEIQDAAILCKHCGRDILSLKVKSEVIDNMLQKYADFHIQQGWTINSMTDQQAVATRRKNINGLVLFIGIIGLLFYIIPGLLILLVGYAARGTETKILTAEDAQKWRTHRTQQAKKLKSDEEARIIAKEKKIAELEGNPLQHWHKLSSNAQALIIVGASIAILVIAAVALSW